MADRIGFGIIGCGRISSKHIEGIINNYQDARLVAVCDKVPEKMGKAVSCYYNYLKNNKVTCDKEVKDNLCNNKIKIIQDYKKLLVDNDVNIVTIATESGFHSQITIDALNAGKHVIVEKPMALSIQDANKMIEVAEEKDLILSVCHQNRFNPTIKKLRDALEKDRFGKLIHAVASVRWNRNDDYFNMDEWHGTLALDGGILMNQCLHNIDMLQWMLGDVERVSAEADTFLRNIETEDVGMALVRFKNGAIGVIEGTVCIYPRNLEETFNIFGEKGTVRVAGIAMNEIIDWKFKDASFDEEDKMKELSYQTDTVYGYGHNLLFKDVINSIRKKRKPLIDGREGKKVVELILGIYKAKRTGQAVVFPLGEYSTTTGVK